MLNSDVATAQAASRRDAGRVVGAIKTIWNCEKAIPRTAAITTFTITAALGVDVAHLDITNRVEGDITAITHSRTGFEYPSGDAVSGSQENIATISHDIACGNPAVSLHSDSTVSC